MTVSSLTSLTNLQNTASAATLSGPAASTDGQDFTGTGLSSDDGSGGAAGGLASLQSPSQLFSPDSLNALISAQTGQNADSSQGSSGATSVHHHHHHSGAGGAPDATATQNDDATDTTPTASASTSAAAEAQATSDTTASSIQTTLASLLATL